MRRCAAALICLTALVLAAAGCGSNTVSRSKEVARANAICLNAQREVRELTTSSALSGEAGIVTSEAARLAALPPSSQAAALLRRYVSAVRASAAAFGQAARRVAHGGSLSSEQVSALESTGTRAAQLAAQFGIRYCAASPEAVATVVPG